MKLDKAANCPDAAKHTKQPEGYVARSDWAYAKLKTHRQKQCAGCGLWVIWVKHGTPPALAPEHDPRRRSEPAREG